MRIKPFADERKAGILWLLLINLFAVMVAFYIQRSGTGISPDTIQYYAAGANFFEGRGLMIADYLTFGGDLIPMTHWPPLYPLVLTAFNLVIAQFGSAALIINTICLCTTATLAYILLKVQFLAPTLIAVSGTLILILSRPILMIHAWAWSEPIFINCILLSWVFLIRFNQTRRVTWLLFSACATAAAMLTRYAGLALFLANLTGLILMRESIRKKSMNAIIFGIASLSPFFLWLLRNYLLTKQFANREIFFHPVLSETLRVVWNSIQGWFYPDSPRIAFEYGLPLLFASACLLLFVLVNKFLRAEQYKSGAFQSFQFFLLGIFFLSYATFVYISASFFDAGIPLDERILSPLYTAGILLLAATVGSLLNTIESKPVKFRFQAVMGLMIAIFLLGFGAANQEWVTQYSRSGLGYSKASWTQSPTLIEMRFLPENSKIITNAPDFVWFATSKDTFFYPAKYNPATAATSLNMESQFAQLESFIQSGPPVYVVHFIDIGRSYLVSEADMVQKLGLRLISETSDGRIYQTGE